MGLSYTTINLSSLFNHKHLRLDGKFWSFFAQIKTCTENEKQGVPLKHIAFMRKGEALTEETASKGNIPVIAGGKSSPYKHEKENYSGNIVTVSASGAAGYVWYHNYPIWASDCTVVFSKDENEFLTKFLYFCLKLNQESIYKMQHGSEQPHVYKEDFESIRIPRTPYSKQKKIIELISPIEKKINKLMSKQSHKKKIIDDIFMTELNIQNDSLTRTISQKTFNTNIVSVANASMRLTPVQHSPRVMFIKNLHKKDSTRFAEILTHPIIRGLQPDYTDDGVKVIKTLNINDGEIDIDDTEFVSYEFMEQNNSSAIYSGDILLTSTGEGRGKFALYQGGEVCLADSHISIIRISDENFSKDFVNYYCQSFLGEGQIKYIERHIKGTPEIYKDDLVEFRILNVPKERQRTIVASTRKKLAEQERYRREIITLQDEISTIVKKHIVT